MTTSLASFFDEEYYLRKNPDVAQSLSRADSPVTTGYEHFALFGMREGRNPSVFFDTPYYIAQNPDVSAVVTAGTTTAYEHFVNYGNKEIRSPTAFFDASWYLANNTDVAVPVYRGELTAYGHAFASGFNEIRHMTPFFSPTAYVMANTDVGTAVQLGHASPLRHFAEYGVAESRSLGNGIELSWFLQDTTFTRAVFTGDFTAAFARVSAVAPFLPSFQKPDGYSYAATLSPPEDFISTISLVIPSELTEATAPDSYSKLVIGHDTSAKSLTLSGTGATAGVTVDLGTGKITDGTKILMLRTDVTYTTVDVSDIATAPLTVKAGTGAVTITGSARADILIGGEGADTLIGGADLDTLTGGAGADTFVLASSSASDADTITDFVSGTDKISLSDAVFTLTGAAGAALAVADYTEVADAAALTGGSLTAATDAQKIIVLLDSGSIYFNSNGASAGGLTLIGVLQNAGAAVDPAITDFVLG